MTSCSISTTNTLVAVRTVIYKCCAATGLDKQPKNNAAPSVSKKGQGRICCVKITGLWNPCLAGVTVFATSWMTGKANWKPNWTNKIKTSCLASFEGKYEEYQCPSREYSAFLLEISYTAFQHEISVKYLIKKSPANEQNTTTMACNTLTGQVPQRSGIPAQQSHYITAQGCSLSQELRHQWLKIRTANPDFYPTHVPGFLFWRHLLNPSAGI